MENQKNNSEEMGKTIENLKDDSVKGDAIKGGGTAIDGPPVLPTGPGSGPVIASNEPILPGGQVVQFGDDPLNHNIDLGPIGGEVGDI